ncbi:MAG: hypothetical protein HY594_04165 [Candidatus Omnitrophica bacterium]|nr:hypothetical protein [Candidatus Omnitrophota bacterium]
MDRAISKHGVPIRLPLERWFPIEENHDELAGRYSCVLEAVADPDFIVRGYAGEFLAVRAIESSKFLVVVYREQSAEDGFVITAFLTKRVKSLLKRGVLWQKEKMQRHPV